MVSFLTIGIMWLNHHTMLSAVTRVNRAVLVLNLFLLMGVVAIPFPTALVADHLTATGAGGRVAAVHLRPGHGRDLDRLRVDLDLPGAHQHELGPRRVVRTPRLSTIRFTAGNVGYIAGTLIALISPVAALIIFGLLAVYYLFDHLPSEEIGRRRRGARCQLTTRTGSQTRTLVPLPGLDSSVAWPPCAVAMACTIDKPRPLPPGC